MKTLFTIVALSCALPMLQARASDLRMTVEAPHFTCDGAKKFYSRVDFIAGDAGEAPLPCCNGKIGCAQFLSTNTIVRQPHQWRG